MTKESIRDHPNKPNVIRFQYKMEERTKRSKTMLRYNTRKQVTKMSEIITKTDNFKVASLVKKTTSWIEGSVTTPGRTIVTKNILGLQSVSLNAEVVHSALPDKRVLHLQINSSWGIHHPRQVNPAISRIAYHPLPNPSPSPSIGSPLSTPLIAR